jgi:uncharacterized phage protein (TIGR01671 family)
MKDDMRKIEFRGQRKDNREWVYGYYVIADGQHFIFTGETGLSQVTPVHHLMYTDYVRHEVIPETVGEYTCLKDKNGIDKIYEGDIAEDRTGTLCEIKHGDFLPRDFMDYYQETYGFTKVHKLHGFYVYYPSNDECCIIPANPAIKIIGNIHDNPELLGRG